ncbi:hypothetical protein BT67DRAFT_442309 [Trichocladium antarcticum]|uniref:Uncharacterized protein n=1 Tax=Trichocladium antarcticum TaxID=1450529 RepID=A0AAN6ZDK1_9PEZI|nr:hypothetical protein BT67DRAFT_442309 [Trichocladium antarcticum]
MATTLSPISVLRPLADGKILGILTALPSSILIGLVGVCVTAMLTVVCCRSPPIIGSGPI